MEHATISLTWGAAALPADLGAYRAQSICKDKRKSFSVIAYYDK
jgi:hypothetical protein